MKRLAIALAVLGTGLIMTFWTGRDLFITAARADQNGTSGDLNPVNAAILVLGLLAASGGLVASTYIAAKWVRVGRSRA